jgi:peptide-methionine (S)-S-oxide reductase
VRTRVGYAGGTLSAPTYEGMGDHTETIQIDYDPSRVSYEDLLDVFWDSHTPTGASWGTQYRSLILVHDDAQRDAVVASRAVHQEKLGRKITTAVETYRSFTRAEDYHQKFTLRQWKKISGELTATLRTERAFVDSTAAARLNGYLAGQGDLAQLERDLPALGLSKETQLAVLTRVKERHR